MQVIQLLQTVIVVNDHDWLDRRVKRTHSNRKSLRIGKKPETTIIAVTAVICRRPKIAVEVMHLPETASARPLVGDASPTE